MNNSKKIMKNENVLLNQINLIKALGRSTAQLLCQLHYWLENKKSGIIYDGIKWIYNTAKQWGEQIGLSERQVRTNIKKLAELGIIIVKKINKKKYDQTNYLTINYDKLYEHFDEEILISSHSAISADLERQKTTSLNTKNNNKDEYKSDKTVCQTTSNSNVSPYDSPQVEKIEKYILKQEKNIKECEKTIETNPHALNEYQESKTNTVQDMFSMWKKNFEKNEDKLDKNLSRNLVAAFKNKFNSDLSQWDYYLKRIKSSAFLTSKDFYLSLSWVLRFSTIDRIEKGDLGVKNITKTKSESELNKKLEEHFSALDEPKKCIEVRQKIAKVIGLPAYLAWFTKVVFVINDRGIQFKARTSFENDYITTHYGYLLSR